MARSESETRCNCTMEELGGQFLKPYFGYYPPNPKCKTCKGTGKHKLTVVFETEKAKRVWIGICPICGTKARGIYLEYDNDSIRNGPPHEYEFPDFKTGKRVKGLPFKCPNKECPNEFTTWTCVEK